MPVTPTYPGVYIEEIPSGVHTIIGVATSITAFLGRTERGPDNLAVEINSYGDFERQFGGLNVKYPLSYAVRDFFVNGGSQAIIVRLFKESPPPAPPAGGGAPPAAVPSLAKLAQDTLNLVAASKGSWGQKLRARVEAVESSDLPWLDTFGLTAADLFNLYVQDTATKVTERFLNVTVKTSPRQVDRVLENGSNLVRLDGALAGAVPAPNDDPTKGENVWTDAKDVNGKRFSVGVAGDVANSANLTTSLDFLGRQADLSGMFALDKVDLFNLLAIPPDTRSGDLPTGVASAAAQYCFDHRAVLIVDPFEAWGDNPSSAVANVKAGLPDLGLTFPSSRNAAIFFPRVKQSDPLMDNQTDVFAPCGIITGIMARTDAARGVWKAPAGIEAGLNGIQGLQVNLNDAENGQLNPLAVNCLRSFPVIGPVVWGSRTARGADQLADDWKYIPVRRTALYIEESLYRGLKWVVFEPNDEPLWAQIRLNVGAFLHDLFRKGAFQGSTPRDAYFVKCDRTTTTQSDINQGIVNIFVGFAPLKPAEFVIIQLQQMTGQIEV